MHLILISLHWLVARRDLQLLQATQKNGGFHFHGNRHSSFLLRFLRYCSALKEMNDDRNHREQ
jgi:hypothetical protein